MFVSVLRSLSTTCQSARTKLDALFRPRPTYLSLQALLAHALMGFRNATKQAGEKKEEAEKPVEETDEENNLLALSEKKLLCICQMREQAESGAFMVRGSTCEKTRSSCVLRAPGCV